MKNWYGGVLPGSLFSDRDMADKVSGFNKQYEQYGLKLGVVIQAIEPEDQRSQSKLFVEYDVLVIEQEKDLGYSLSTFRNCIKKDSFGGIADYFEAKLRPGKRKGKSGAQDVAEQDGSVVLLQCLDSFADKAIIVGAHSHPKRKKKLNKKMGHALIGEFNGIEMEIDKEGAFLLNFKGATDNDGKALKAKVGGSYFKITAAGTIEVANGAGEIIRLDKEKNAILIESKKNTNIKVGADLTLEVLGKSSWSTKGTAAINVEGAANFDLGSLAANIKGQAQIDASGLTINGGSQAKISAGQITLEGMTNVGSAGGAPALVPTTMFLGTIAGAPIISMAIGPFSSKVKIAP